MEQKPLAAQAQDAGVADGSGNRRAILRKYPYPFVAAATVASDIDNASFNRFSAVHRLFCGSEVIRPGTTAWQTLGLNEGSRWFDGSAGGVHGLGLDLADTFFLIADDVSMGMYRYDSRTQAFREDVSDGQNAREAILGWIKNGQIDSFHGFMHYTRDQVLPLLEKFYEWCEREGVTKPSTWINHSVQACPSGLCPESFRPNPYYSLARQIARFTIGPLTGRARYPIVWRQLWYQGAKPGTPYYINDVLQRNGLRYIWLEAGQDMLPNIIALPEYQHGGRPSILEPVTMDDGVRYYRFKRCYGKIDAPGGVTVALRTSKVAFDASRLFSAANLEHLCHVQGTCILFTHWTLARSLPMQDETIEHFHRLRTYRDQGKIWVTKLSRLLEWTRLRAFLKYASVQAPSRLIIAIEPLADPIFGRQALRIGDCDGLAFDLPPETEAVEIRIAGDVVPPKHVRRKVSVCWISASA